MLPSPVVLLVVSPLPFPLGLVLAVGVDVGKGVWGEDKGRGGFVVESDP